jgi:SAM-dependent methyltransferase
MDRLDDQETLLADQYEDSSNLNARQQLHRRFSTSDVNWFEWVFDRFDLPADGRLLELGCGPGDLWRENADRIPDGWTVTLSDFSPGMVRDARENLRNVPHDFEYESFDAQEIPFADGSFDAVVANHMLYHVPDLDAAYAEIRRVLKSGGRLYAATNARDNMQELYDFVDEFQPGGATCGAGADSFRLENGGDQLAEHFESVELHTLDNGLHITEAGPLVAYVCSGLVDDDLDREGFAEYAEHRIEADGPLDVSKETGIFVAWKEP